MKIRWFEETPTYKAAIAAGKSRLEAAILATDAHEAPPRVIVPRPHLRKKKKKSSKMCERCGSEVAFKGERFGRKCRPAVLREARERARRER